MNTVRQGIPSTAAGTGFDRHQPSLNIGSMPAAWPLSSIPSNGRQRPEPMPVEVWITSPLVSIWRADSIAWTVSPMPIGYWSRPELRLQPRAWSVARLRCGTSREGCWHPVDSRCCADRHQRRPVTRRSARAYISERVFDRATRSIPQGAANRDLVGGPSPAGGQGWPSPGSL